MPLPFCVRMMQDPRLQFAGPDDEGCTSTLVTDGTVTPKDTTNCVLTPGAPGSCAPADAAVATCEYVEAGCVSELTMLDGRGKVWTPDSYLPTSVTHDRSGTLNDGQLLRISPDGGVFWSQRLQVTLDCTMDFSQMPYDKHSCKVVIGSFSQSSAEVLYKWKGAALLAIEEQKHAEWIIGAQTTQSEVSRPWVGGDLVAASPRDSYSEVRKTPFYAPF
jgi:hypothetical protein